MKLRGKNSRVSLPLKSIALFTLITFVSTQAIVPAPTGFAQNSNPPGGPVSTAQVLNGTITVPPELGKIEESFQGNTQKTILFIQDAHDSLEAQENIAKLISRFVKENGIKTVFEEGYEGTVPTDRFFGFIKDPKIKQKVSYFLLDKLRLGGAEYAHVNRTQDFDLIGVDSLKLYSENIKVYRDASKTRAETEADLNELFNHISILANRHFPKELKSWLRSKERSSKGELPLLDYLKTLHALYLKTKPNSSQFPQEYPALSILLVAETTKDKKLITQLNALDSKFIFEEMTRLEKNISDAFLRNDQDKKIFDYYQGLSLLKRLNQIQLTQSEYDVAKETLQNFKTHELADFIVSLTHKSLVLSKEWERHINDAAQFYNVAQTRDRSISEHLKSFMGDSTEDAAVLVFGGFHATAIKELLREQGLSYAVISPRITKIEKRHQDYYRQLMSVGHHPFETPFLVARANKPPSAYFTASLVGDFPIDHELRAITSVVTTPGDPSSSDLIEQRLTTLSQNKETQSVRVPAGPNQVRSEMRMDSERVREMTGKLQEMLSQAEAESSQAQAANQTERVEYVQITIKEILEALAGLADPERVSDATMKIVNTYVPDLEVERFDLASSEPFRMIKEANPERARHMVRVERFFRALTTGNFDYFLSRLKLETSEADRERYRQDLGRVKSVYETLTPEEKTEMWLEIKAHDFGYIFLNADVGHEASGADYAESYIRDDLHMSPETAVAVSWLIQRHMSAGSLYLGELRYTKFMEELDEKGFVKLLLHNIADAASVLPDSMVYYPTRLATVVEWFDPVARGRSLGNYDQYRFEKLAKSSMNSDQDLTPDEVLRLNATIRSIFGAEEKKLRGQWRDSIDILNSLVMVSTRLAKGNSSYKRFAKWLRLLGQISLLAPGREAVFNSNLRLRYPVESWLAADVINPKIEAAIDLIPDVCDLAAVKAQMPELSKDKRFIIYGIPFNWDGKEFWFDAAYLYDAVAPQITRSEMRAEDLSIRELEERLAKRKFELVPLVGMPDHLQEIEEKYVLGKVLNVQKIMKKMGQKPSEVGFLIRTVKGVFFVKKMRLDWHQPLNKNEAEYISHYVKLLLDGGISLPMIRQKETGALLMETHIPGETEPVFYTVEKQLIGKQVFRDQAEPEQLERVARELARIHAIGRTWEYVPSPDMRHYDLMQAVRTALQRFGGDQFQDEMKRVLAPEDYRAVVDILQKAAPFLLKGMKKLPKEPIMSDFNFTNMMFSEDLKDIVGIFDMDQTRWGYRFEDFLPPLLFGVSEFKPHAENAVQELAVMVRAYQGTATAPLGKDEIDLLPYHVLFQAANSILNRVEATMKIRQGSTPVGVNDVTLNEGSLPILLLRQLYPQFSKFVGEKKVPFSSVILTGRSEMRATEVDDRGFGQLKRARHLVSEKKFTEAVKVLKPLVDHLNGLISQKKYTQTDPYVLANAYAAPLLLKVAQDPDRYFNAARLRKSIQILIFDSKGRVLLQKRGPFKRLFPSKFTVSANAKPSKGDDAAAIKEKVKVAIGEEVGINPDLSKISRVGDPDSHHHYIKSYTFEAYNDDEAQRLERASKMHEAQSGIAVDYDAVKHALVVYVLKQDEQLSAELERLILKIASETGIPNSPAVENLEESSLFTYVLSPDEERQVKEELIPGKVRYKQQALENTASLTKDALKAIDSDDVEFRDWADVIVAFRERRTDFAEDLVATHFSDDEIVQKVSASIRNEYFLNLDDPRASSPIISGGKGASLHHLRRMILQDADVKVPEGFVLPADVFFRFVMGNATLRKQIEQLDKLFEVIKTAPKDKRADITVQIETLSRSLREGIRNIELPQDLMMEISKVLERVRGPVAVRSSASVEDSASAACAGKAESFLNQGTPRQVADSIKKVWSSLFNDGFVSYRINNDMTGVPLMPVVILKMVNARSAGTLFSVDTNTGRPVFRIEANFGLGESVVSSKVTPDRWLVAPDASMILESTISNKTIMTVRSDNGTREVAIEPEMQNQASMRNEEVLELAQIALKIQNSYIASGIANIDTEFAVDQDGAIYIVQTRPETTVKKGSLKVIVTMVDEEKLPLGVQKIELTKSGSIIAVNGVSTGRLMVELPPVGIQDEDFQKEFIDKIIDRLQSGDILVTVDTDNKWDNAFKRISGVITDQGGHTSHTAVTSRENGIPCLVATRNATDQLKSYSGKIVTFDSYRKAIYLTDQVPVKTVEIDMAMWNPVNELLKKPAKARDFWMTGEEYVEFYRPKENFMDDLEGFWRGRPKTPFGYLELDYYAKAFDRYAQNLNRLFPSLRGAFKGVSWKFKNRIVFTNLMAETDGLQNPLFKLTLNDFSNILGERVRTFAEAEEFFAHLDRLDASNVRQTMDLFVELLSWMHIARPFHHVFRTKFAIPQERLMTENSLSSDRRPLMELVGLARASGEDRHWLIKLTHWDKVKELAAIEELIRADEDARRILSNSPEIFSKERPKLYQKIVEYAHRWKTSHEDIRKGVEVDAFLEFVRGNVRADPGKMKTITVQPLLRMLQKWDLKQKGVLNAIRAADPDLYLAIRLYGRMKQANASQGPIGDFDELANLAIKNLIEEKQSEQGLTEAIEIIFDQYPTLGRIFAIGSQEFSFMEDAHQYITRFQKQLYHLLLDVAKQHPTIFGERPEQVFDLGTDEIVALIVDKNPVYLRETFKRHDREEKNDAELEREWGIVPAQALENYRNATRPIIKGLEDQITQAGYDGVKAHYATEIKRITDRIERLETLARGQAKESSNATSRSEMRRAAGKVISAQLDQIVQSVRRNAQPATVFMDAKDWGNLSEAQKQEYFFVALANKAIRIVVYNEHGQVWDKDLTALLKLDRVERTGGDLKQSARHFANPNVPAIQLSKDVSPSAAEIQGLRGKVAFFRTTGNESGTLATALLWAISGGKNVRFQGVREENGFWTVDETLLDAIQRTYESNFVIAVAA